MRCNSSGNTAIVQDKLHDSPQIKRSCKRLPPCGYLDLPRDAWAASSIKAATASGFET